MARKTIQPSSAIPRFPVRDFPFPVKKRLDSYRNSGDPCEEMAQFLAGILNEQIEHKVTVTSVKNSRREIERDKVTVTLNAF